MLTTRRAILLLPVGAWLSGIVPGCKGRNLAGVGAADTPFVFALSPSHKGSDHGREKLEKFLREHSGLTLAVRVTASSKEAIGGAGSPGVDAWLLDLFDYLFCHQEYRLHAGLRVLREGGARSYKGVIVTKADGPLRALKELDGKTVAFVDRYSTSGFVYPAKLLRDAGAKPVVTFAGAHQKALEELRAGRAAAAATFAGAVESDATLRVIAHTEEIPNEPVSFREGLDEQIKKRFLDALIAFAGTEEGKAVLHEMAGITGFELATDDDYRSVHDVVRGADKTVQDLVPRGWWIHNENRRPLSAYAP